MFETCLLAILSLAIVLYVQARLSAREIRRNRARCARPKMRELVLKRRV